MINKITILAAGMVLMGACTDMFSPAPELHRTVEDMLENPDYAQGILGYAYGISPFQVTSVSDVATDDAVTNETGSQYRRMATGGWSAVFSPDSHEQWAPRMATIQNLNTFLAKMDEVVWTKNKAVNQIYHDRLQGEAHGLRALNMYFLLRTYGGWATDGTLLGVPIIKETDVDVDNTNYNVPRATFQACVDHILNDLQVAIDILPAVYRDVASIDEVPAKYVTGGITNESEYNSAAGEKFLGRLDGNTARGIYAQVALLAASPAFSDGTTVTWEQAANAAVAALAPIGGVSGLASNGHTWYANTGELWQDRVPQEILWTGRATNGGEDWNIGLQQERDNFPPSFWGSGDINPSQNLVDAFPMANGYPIDAAEAGYNENDPYTGRDPRLTSYVIVNGSSYKGATIITGTYSPDANGINKDAGSSTRTGYYMKKLLHPDASANPVAENTQLHYPVRIRYTEIFLAYAEAANEAWGPQVAGSHGYSAYDVIKAIRTRAGITGGDVYLESIKGDKEKMRKMIQNERRLELCFENKRFYDLRRWNLPLDETVRGMQIDQATDGTLTYTKVDVETRGYLDYMRYGPVPNLEILKWSEYKQNKGW